MYCIVIHFYAYFRLYSKSVLQRITLFLSDAGPQRVYLKTLKILIFFMEINNIAYMSVFAVVALIMICSFAIPVLVDIIEIDGAELMTGLTPIIGVLVVVLIVCAIRGIMGYMSVRR